MERDNDVRGVKFRAHGFFRMIPPAMMALLEPVFKQVILQPGEYRPRQRTPCDCRDRALCSDFRVIRVLCKLS